MSDNGSPGKAGVPKLGPSMAAASAPESRAQSPTPSVSTLSTGRTLKASTSHGRLSKLMGSGRARASSSASQTEASPITAFPDETGVNSSKGRTTPDQRRTGRAAAASLLAADARYKKYTQQVERALSTFESVNEWADFISFLSRLLKTLQSTSPGYNEIPRKITVAKRLAQCLNPALPSGVHQRALEVYSFIFSLIGEDGLRRDLQIWSSGLFPFFQFAATSVRPALIQIYETYYLPLGDDLRPAAKAFLLALLPGLEEETGDFFDRILSLLSKVSQAISPPFFLQSIFLILITTPSARLSALNYLSRNIPKPSSSEDALAGQYGPDLGLLVRGLGAATEDDNSLVRRTAMDLLLSILQLDGRLMRTELAESDKLVLMRAVAGIVLRKDLSLSRRLYAWLLGPDSSTAEAQKTFFTKHGLDLLAKSLLTEMQSNGDAVVEFERPYTVVVALLDKWEIGDALAPRLALPALASLKGRQEQTGVDQALITHSLIEAIDPFALWRIMHKEVISEVQEAGSAVKRVHLLKWVTTTVNIPDDEVRSIYAPLLFISVLDVLKRASELDFEEALDALLDLLPLVNPVRFASTMPPEDTQKIDVLAEAEDYYDSEETSSSGPSILDGFYNIAITSIVSILEVIASKRAVDHSTACAIRAFRLFDAVLAVGSKARVDDLDWPRERWQRASLELVKDSGSFVVVDAAVTGVLAAFDTPHLRLKSDVNFHRCVLERSFSYLIPAFSLYHSRAVDLIWRYSVTTPVGTLQNLLCAKLSSSSETEAERARRSFGVLWRLSPDSSTPGEAFFMPVHIILDALKSNDPVKKRRSETWMRCNLRSYFRILDPLLVRLLRVAGGQAPSECKVHGKMIKRSRFTSKIDYSMVNTLSQGLLTLFQFGGQGLSRSCSTTLIRSSGHPSLSKTLGTVGHGDDTYAQLVSTLFVRFLNFEATSGQNSSLDLRLLQHTSCELLQVIASRGDLDDQNVRAIQSATVSTLFCSVHGHNLDIQPKLLHLLHTAINANSPAGSSTDGSASRSVKSSHSFDGDHSLDVRRVSRQGEADGVDSLLVQLVVDGIGVQSNRPVLQHWIDFILMTAACFQGPLQPVLLALGDGIGNQLLSTVQEVVAHAQTREADHDSICEATDIDTTMLLTAYERLILLSVSKPTPRRNVEPEKVGLGIDGGPGLFGYVSGVFTPDPGHVEEDSPLPAAVGLASLRESVGVLLKIWLASSNTSAGTGHASSSAMIVLDKTRVRCRRVIEKLFKVEALDVLESLLANWAELSSAEDEAVCELIDALTPNAQKAISLLISIVKGSFPEKAKKASVATHRLRTGQLALIFMEIYLRRLEGPIALQVWGVTFEFAREVLSTSGAVAGKQQLYPILRCVTRLGSTVAKTSALEDRKYRRDLQDTFVKLLETLLNNISKIADDGLWGRSQLKGGRDEKFSVSMPSSAFNEILAFLAIEILPNLRDFLHDSDKVASAATAITNQAVIPALRQRKQELEIDPAVLQVLLSLSQVPSAGKAWRTAALDVFNDARFFRSSAAAGSQWRPLVSRLMELDRDRIQEFLGRIGATPSANIFTNREAEMIARSTNLRRLSFILYSSDKDHYVTQLPGIQEKLVDILRTTIVSPMVHSEVYLCLRVLLCRLSPQYLANFWPVILAELLRVFEQTMEDIPADGSDDLQLVLAACKFLDLLLVLQTEDFQIQQWLFVTDTTDAIYPSSDFSPEAIMDRLAEILAQHDHSHMSASREFTNSVDGVETSLRRPHLAGLHSISSIGELQAFFSHASLFAFEGVYAGADVDWDAVETGLAKDMFEDNLDAK